MNRMTLFTTQNLDPLELARPLAVVAHDAGGANQIIALLQEYNNLEGIRVYMQGPALELWRRAFPHHVLCNSVDETLDGSAVLIAGTGWQSNLEYEAIDRSLDLGIPTVAVLDHWVNYKQRFERGGRFIQPDEFWVVDNYAFAIAKQTFPESVIRQLPSYYLENQVRQISPPCLGQQKLLYLLEPARSYWGGNQPGEFQALEYLIEHIDKIPIPAGVELVLRTHPSERHDKYFDWVSKQGNCNITCDHSDTLVDAISKSNWVVGCESYGMVVALMAGRVVYCSLPPWAPACRLPHESIVHIASHF